MLYEFCDKNQIDYQRVGKLIFINDISSMNDLENLLRNGTENGLKEIRLLNKGELIKMEPNLTAHSALFIESTGLIDSHAYGMVHEAIIENNNGYIILDCPFLNGENRILNGENFLLSGINSPQKYGKLRICEEKRILLHFLSKKTKIWTASYY